MTTNIQVRAVDDELARAAKERASATHRSLSAYIRDLIADDLARESSRRAMRDLLQEIAENPRRPRVPREEIAEALAEVRDELVDA